MEARLPSRAPFHLVLAVAALTLPAAGQHAITRVSVDSNGVEGNDDSGLTPPAFSSDGRFVAFDSAATNLVKADKNSRIDIFVHDRVSGSTVRVSVDSSGVEGNDHSSSPTISADGRFVAFVSISDNLVVGDANAHADVFLHDRDPDRNGVFDEGNGVTTRVNVSSSGKEANYGGDYPSISADGALIAFESIATNLVGGDNNGRADIFLHNRVTGMTFRQSVDSNGVEGDEPSYGPRISADGLFVSFWSYARNLVANDTNNASDVFVRDRVSKQTTRVSVDSNGNQGAASFGPAPMSSDGSVVVFQSNATNFVTGDTNGVIDVFLHDRVTGVTSRVSVDSAGIQGDATSVRSTISTDGTVVAFDGMSTNLVAGDDNADSDVFIHDGGTGETSGASFHCGGKTGNRASAFASLSGDGLLVAFSSYAGDLVAGDANFVSDVFVHDRTVLEPSAYWNNYDVGYPGTLGVPTLTASDVPSIDSTITIDVGNSLGQFTVGFMLIGSAKASNPTSDGGTLLVDFSLIVPYAIWPAGLSLLADIPSDPALCGTSAFVQVIEMDGGAVYGLSFTAGLELAFGR